MNLRFWKRVPSPEMEALRLAYEEAKLSLRYSIQILEAQNRDLTTKMLELLEPGITARLAPRAPRPVQSVQETQSAILAAKLRARPVALPGYEEIEES